MFVLDHRDPRPIYEQVKSQLRRLILTGALKPGEKIPSVRDLAGTLAINPNTIQRAYRELEQEGFLLSQAGRGSFVADTTEAADSHSRELLTEFDKKVTELLELGVSKETLIQHIELGGSK